MVVVLYSTFVVLSSAAGVSASARRNNVISIAPILVRLSRILNNIGTATAVLAVPLPPPLPCHGLWLSLWLSFLSNRCCCRYQTWICGYVQRALGIARVWSGVFQGQHVYGGGLYSYYPRCALIRDRRQTAWTA